MTSLPISECADATVAEENGQRYDFVFVDQDGFDLHKPKTFAATTEIARNRDAQGFPQNKQAARAGGTVAGNARRELETKSGRKVVTRENYLALKQSTKKVQRLRR